MRKAFFFACAFVLLPIGCNAPSLPGRPQQPESSAQRKSSSAYCLASPCTYVTTADSVNIYSLDQHGVTRPIEHIRGAKTGLLGAGAVALDADHNVYVADISGSYQSAILVYPAGQYGNIAPVRTITGPDTDMGIATGLAVDSAGNIYVTSWFTSSSCAGSVTEYAAGASGDAAPIAEIKGPETELCVTGGIAVDSNGNSYVTSGHQHGSSINVYAAGSTGNVRPRIAIFGKRTLLNYALPGGITLDAGNNIYVAANAGESLIKFRAGAHGDARPMQAIYGTRTKLQYTYGVAVDPSGEIYANNRRFTNVVIVFARNANGDVPPIRTIVERIRHFRTPSNIAIR